MGGLAVVFRSCLYGTAIVLQRGFEPEPFQRCLLEDGVTPDLAGADDAPQATSQFPRHRLAGKPAHGSVGGGRSRAGNPQSGL